jgi:hypothetical protein
MQALFTAHRSAINPQANAIVNLQDAEALLLKQADVCDAELSQRRFARLAARHAAWRSKTWWMWRAFPPHAALCLLRDNIPSA